MDTKKSCGTCINCDKVHVGQPDEFWACEVHGFFYNGMCPSKCSPPDDEPCKFYSETERFDIDRYL